MDAGFHGNLDLSVAAESMSPVDTLGAHRHAKLPCNEAGSKSAPHNAAEYLTFSAAF
jgi:hypothetical protein